MSVCDNVGPLGHTGEHCIAITSTTTTNSNSNKYV